MAATVMTAVRVESAPLAALVKAACLAPRPPSQSTLVRLYRVALAVTVVLEARVVSGALVVVVSLVATAATVGPVGPVARVVSRAMAAMGSAVRA